MVYKVVDLPEIATENCKNSVDYLLEFFRSIGWNGEDHINSSKIYLSKEDWIKLCGASMKIDPKSNIQAGLLWMNNGPSSHEDVPEGKVFLEEGWVTPGDKRQEE